MRQAVTAAYPKTLYGQRAETLVYTVEKILLLEGRMRP
jgi:hypothetical protein